MKKTLCVLVAWWAATFLYGQSSVTIGTGTATQKQPFGMWASYERSASLYLSGEIGSAGPDGMLITALGWYTATGYPPSCPTRIYLKGTSLNNLSTTTWASMTSGATLVYDQTTSFPSTGWKTIDIADFVYESGNLLVLCETNYGGNGATFYPVFRYSIASNKHQYWYEYDIPPAGSGTVNANRPNLTIHYTLLTSPVAPPSGFLAQAGGPGQVNLSWRKNNDNDPVMIAVSTTGSFGQPAGIYAAGDLITGGGTVVYAGGGTSFSHTSGLNPGTTYYYRAWSFHAPVPEYSPGTDAAATTLCSSISVFPDTSAFESTVFPPSCWSRANNPWNRSSGASAYGDGTGSAFADFINTSIGFYDLISPVLNFGTLSTVSVTFDHAYATDQEKVDKLELWCSGDEGATYFLETTWLGGTNGPLNTGGSQPLPFVPAPGQWATKSQTLPAGTNRVMFRGVSGFGNNLYLDNIIFDGDCPQPVNPVGSGTDATSAVLSWEPAGSAVVWDVIYGSPGFNPENEGFLLTGVSTVPFLLEGLEVGMTYEFYVRSDCGSEQSQWAGPAGFTTACPVYGVPYFESFDTWAIPVPGCFVADDANSDSLTWELTSGFPLSPPNAMTISQSNVGPSDDWLFTPAFGLTEGTTYILSFHCRSCDTGGLQNLELKAGAGPAMEEMLPAPLWSGTSFSDTVYTNFIAEFTPATSGDWYFGWHFFSGTGTGCLLIDDITVDVGLATWTGSDSQDWDNPANWTDGLIPSWAQSVVIPGGTTFNPLVGVVPAECRSLSLEPGAAFTVDPDGMLTIFGNLLIKPGSVFNNQGIIQLKGNLENLSP